MENLSGDKETRGIIENSGKVSGEKGEGEGGGAGEEWKRDKCAEEIISHKVSEDKPL